MSPTALNAGLKINVIPNAAEVQVDARRLSLENLRTGTELLGRIVVKVAAKP